MNPTAEQLANRQRAVQGFSTLSRKQQYVVKKGDTLNDIARRFNTRIQDINGYRSGNPDLIFPGEVLNINKEVPLPVLQNNNVVEYPPAPVQSEPVIPEYDFTANQEQQNTLQQELDKLYKRKQSVYEDAVSRYDELVPDRQKLGNIKAQLDALKIQRQGIKANVADQYRGRGVTRSALNNITSQELTRNALKSLDLQAQGMLLQGNINTALDIINEAVNLEVKPIETEINYKESNLNRLIKAYKDRADAYSKELVAKAKAQKEALQAQKDSLTDLRNMRRDIRIIANTARQGNAPSNVVAEILQANSYEDAIAKAAGYLDLAPGVKARNANRFNSRPRTTTTKSSNSNIAELIKSL